MPIREATLVRRLLLLAGLVTGAWLIGMLTHTSGAQAASVAQPIAAQVQVQVQVLSRPPAPVPVVPIVASVRKSVAALPIPVVSPTVRTVLEVRNARSPGKDQTVQQIFGAAGPGTAAGKSAAHSRHAVQPSAELHAAAPARSQLARQAPRSAPLTARLGQVGQPSPTLDLPAAPAEPNQPATVSDSCGASMAGGVLITTLVLPTRTAGLPVRRASTFAPLGAPDDPSFSPD
ncbi:MAG: hypothetical protein QOE89_1797 [Pseudonocardiales bacterium]|nr:hypothetical protein [Pseudonocardiales bacterium]